MISRHNSVIGLVISVLCFCIPLLSAQNASSYIHKYADIAVSEMHRTGIPASIKLAQGMLESNCGASELASKANNHFGIKCGGDWAGKGFHREDDDYKEGKLVKSCFREFNSAMESFVAHSDFLTDPKKVNRYGCLFELKSSDYKAWARGLSKCGYATDPQYADKLIRIIEDNQLFQFDEGDVLAHGKGKPEASLGYNLVRVNNDVNYVVAAEGETLEAIAARNDVNENQLERYNDHAYQREFPLAKGSKVYIQPKRGSFHGKKKFHTLQAGEDLLFVAQEYGMKIDALMKRNGLEANQVPLAGQKIMLRGKSKTPIRTANPYDNPVVPVVTQKEVVSAKPATTSKPTTTKPASTATTKPAATASTAKASTTKPPTSNTAVQHAAVKPSVPSASKPMTPASMQVPHVVSKGDTLFNIANRYGLSVDELKKRNNLSADTISIGQKLLVTQ
jgi:LysM repeat protein